MASAPAEGRIVTSSPALVDGTAYVGLRDEDGVANNGLVAVRQSDGARRWFSRTDAMVQGSPAVAGGIVYAPDIRGTLYSMDATTGRELWRKRFAVDVQRGLA
jgi:outer membrane protein assembly factor BamB